MGRREGCRRRAVQSRAHTQKVEAVENRPKAVRIFKTNVKKK